MVYFGCYNLISTNFMPDDSQQVYKANGAGVARQSLGIPIAIVIAAALIAGAIIYTGQQSSSGTQVSGAREAVNQETPEITLAPVTEDDYILGNPNAPIVIVEYSDYDCPFCKNFHETMNRIMSEYGPSGKVAWVYRHFPLTQLHPNAIKIAEAAECVGSIGGNEAFWTFSDLIFIERGINDPTDMSRLPEFAERAGVSRAAYTQCVESGRFTEKVQASIDEGLAAGARGTPYSIIIAGDEQGVINGALPYERVKSQIDTLLAQLES
jgi:protein-disulfide isomerase